MDPALLAKVWIAIARARLRGDTKLAALLWVWAMMEQEDARPRQEVA